jgi:hypothetical protein
MTSIFIDSLNKTVDRFLKTLDMFSESLYNPVVFFGLMAVIIAAVITIPAIFFPAQAEAIMIILSLVCSTAVLIIHAR